MTNPLQALVQSHPKYNEVMALINQNGGDAKALFYQKAQEKGINADDFLKSSVVPNIPK